MKESQCMILNIINLREKRQRLFGYQQLNVWGAVSQVGVGAKVNK